jgi:hypothetical protein
MWSLVFGREKRHWVLCGVLTFSFIMSGLAQKPATGSRKELSEKAQEKILKTETANPDSVFVFDNEGNPKRSVKLTGKDRETYQSLERFVQSSEKSPVDSCKHPTSVPPPPCVLCDNGEVVCSGAKFGTRVQMK